MRRLISILSCLAFAKSAVADIPPPSGYKRVPISNIVETERAFPDYRFYRVSWETRFGESIRLATPGDIVPGSPLTIHRDSRQFPVQLIAIPVSTEIDHIPLNDLWEAVEQGKVQGAFIAKAQFGYQRDIPIVYGRNEITWRWRLERITPEEGIVLERIDKDTESFLLQPSDVLKWIALLLAAVMIFRFGFWLFRRHREIPAQLAPKALPPG